MKNTYSIMGMGMLLLILITATVSAADGKVYWLENVAIDGEFEEWDGLERMVTETAVYGGEHKPRDAEGSFTLATDGETLFIFGDIRDDNVRLNTFHNSLAWKGDSLEVYFGTLSAFHEDYEIGDVQMRIVPRSDEDLFEQDFYISYDYGGGGTTALGDVAIEIKRNGYLVEAAILLEEIENPNISIGAVTRC